MSKSSGWFVNTSLEGLYLHELGHKFHYDLIDTQLSKELGREIHVYSHDPLDKIEEKAYTRAEMKVNQPVYEFIKASKVKDSRFLENNLSRYAASKFDDNSNQGIKEVFAEWFAAIEENELIS